MTAARVPCCEDGHHEAAATFNRARWAAFVAALGARYDLTEAQVLELTLPVAATLWGLQTRGTVAARPRQIWTLMADPAAPVDVRAVAAALRPAIGDPLCPFYSDTDAAESLEPECSYDRRCWQCANCARRAAESAVAADVAEAEGKLLGCLDEGGDITW